MKIILVEERPGGEILPEQSFNQEVVRIGRDASDCRIIFDRKTFPMVSRKHAELRLTGGEWFLHDLNSSYGTFIDGQKIFEPQVVEIGQRIQFGVQGPILRVAGLESRVNNRQNLVAESFQNPKGVPFAVNRTNSNQSQTSQKAQLEFVGANDFSAPFAITKESVWLGRDPNGDIVFEPTEVMVSRKHAEIRRENGKFILADNNSFNGTLLNEQRISKPTPLFDNDEIRLGLGGPVLRFIASSQIAAEGANLAAQRSAAIGQVADSQNISDRVGSKTIAANLGNLSSKISAKEAAEPQLLMSLALDDRRELVIGRNEASDIKLDGLQISNRHARILRTNAGIIVEDLNSTNGVYVNGNRINRETITPADAVQIGSFVIRIDEAGNVGVFDTRSKTRIDAVKLTKDVKSRAAGGKVRLLDDVSLSIQPNEFVGLIGASGAGKSTLMDALNGARPASSGSVLINNLDLYRHLDSLKQSIGYVPQDDIIYRELTVYRTLYYVARLRLSRDVSRQEINQIIEEILDVTGLTEHRNAQINELSGGQRKRVSIAVELVTKPSVIFLDEPASGLDPANEEKIMRLFRQIAESGRTVILTTHAMENVNLFDKIAVMMRGRLVFFGAPGEALRHLNAASFKELFDKLEEPFEQKIRHSGNADRRQITEQIAEEWKQKFAQTPQYQKYVYEPLKEVEKFRSKGINKKRQLGIFGSVRQTLTLSRRYAEVLLRDKLNLFILFVQAPIIALLTYFVMGANQPRDFVYFVLSLVSIWFGISVAAREIVRERAVYRRERMVNLGLVPYLASKLFVLGIIVAVQCLLLFLPLKIFDVSGLMPMPGEFFGIPQLWMMLLTGGVGIAIGLLISALVRTSEMATSLVPLILIPQILCSGLVGVPGGVNKVIGLTMPAAWSFDTMKRFSGLDTLEKEGADPNGETEGIGLYKYVETENEKVVTDAKREISEYKRNSQNKLESFENDLRNGNNPFPPQMEEPPRIADAKKIPENLSRYVTFLHPWMHEILNQSVLVLMFCILIVLTLIVLRLRDVS